MSNTSSNQANNYNNTNPTTPEVSGISFAPDTLINIKSPIGTSSDFTTITMLDSGTNEQTTDSVDSTASIVSTVPLQQHATPLPLIGKFSVNKQIRILALGLVLMVFTAAILGVVDTYLFSANALQVEIISDTQIHSQRLAKASLGAIQGDKSAFAQLKESRSRINNNLSLLSDGGDYDDRKTVSLDIDTKNALLPTLKQWTSTDNAANQLIRNEPVLISYGKLIETINTITRPLQEQSETLAALTEQMGLGSPELSSVAELTILSQRISRNAVELTVGKSINREASAILEKDIMSFKKNMALIDESNNTSKSPQVEIFKKTLSKALSIMKTNFEIVNEGASNITTNVANIRQAKIAEQVIFNDSEEFRQQLEKIHTRLVKVRESHGGFFWAGIMSALLALVTAVAIAKVILDENNLRAQIAEKAKESAQAAQEQAQAEEYEVKQLNARNQSAILRLINELQEVADGDLTIQATVSEDMMGAVADSVNLTVEELRTLVARINVTAEGVSLATNKARQTTSMLLQLTEQQTAQIQGTGDRVLDMARNITEVSNRADGSSAVAQKALNASQVGQLAVQASVQGMNGIRDQIQDTAKRIKRLGESSQQISEIVDLIGDITEQTNVLALNASIQAASAGDAGRGFTVVADEVQRLAERSGQATQQIAALVRTIQTDTQDAISAMERSTQGVVEGARLADSAGVAITDISKISQELANIILEISHTTRGQADQAQIVSQAIKYILSMTERTTLGTRETASSTEQLSTLAQELKKSVARFKVTA